MANEQKINTMDDDEIEEENKLLVEENPKDEKITGEREPREKPKNWYFDQYPKRYAAIKQAGEQRNDDKKKFLQSAEKYDALKRSFYNITTAAVDEGVINEDDAEIHKSKIKKVDKFLLEELKSEEKKKFNNRNYNNRSYKK